jgi:hypothetical protein
MTDLLLRLREPRRAEGQAEYDVIGTMHLSSGASSRKHRLGLFCRFHTLKDLLAAFLERAKALVMPARGVAERSR